MVNIQDISCPEAALDKWLAEPWVGERVLAVNYSYSQYYLSKSPLIRLLAIYCHTGNEVCFTVAQSSQLLRRKIRSMAANLTSFHSFVKNNHLPILKLGQPLRLEPVCIAKPWGQEIWYTGIEERGISLVTDGVESTLLSWILSAAPRRLAANREKDINLLKILDPLPEAIYGDLYFELHQEKREVYVITHVDREAWPTGIGAIRYGFNSAIRQKFASDDLFKSAFLDAVQCYQQIRSQIDGEIDHYRLAEGVPLDEPVSAETTKRWMARLPASIVTQEQILREEMNQFTALLPLQQGDVVKVPLRTPHSLQHGVRTVEFQTPVFERMILSFAQKVLTQSHWDTKQAIDVMSLDSPVMSDLEVLEVTPAYRLEEIVQFDDFKVLRITLSVNACHTLLPSDCYGLLMVVDGVIDCDGLRLIAEQALLLPAERGKVSLVNQLNTEVVVLFAYPISL